MFNEKMPMINKLFGVKVHASNEDYLITDHAL
jgi:hypothetical protein